MKRCFSLACGLLSLLAPLAAQAGGFGLPPAVPFCQLQIGDVIIAPAGTPQPAGYPFFLTPGIANSFSTEGRQLLGIPPGYTIAVNIFADRPWSGNLPAWLLVPIGAAPTPPPAPKVCPPPVPAPKPCAPAPVAPKPCPVAPPPCAPPVPPCAAPVGFGGPGPAPPITGERARRF